MDNLSLFKESDQQTISMDGAGKLDIVKMDFVEAESMDWQELFSGFEKLYAITYSSGIGFICSLLKKFKYSEIIFGFDGVLSYNLQEIMAYQINTIKRINKISGKNKLDLVSRIDSGMLRLYVARKMLSHEKIYLLEAEDGRKRVVMGSANMSYSAFSGAQRENISYMDGERAYEWYMSCFRELKENSSDDISVSALTMADDGEHLEEVPIAQTVRVRKALVIEPEQDINEEVKFVLDVKNLAGKLAPSMPKADKKGKLMLSPDTIKIVRKRVVNAQTQEKELRGEYPHLIVDVDTATVSLNDKELELSPDSEAVSQDVLLFIEYMNGYEKFHGNVSAMQMRYFEFANWFFASPFMAPMRDMAIRYNQNTLSYPVFGLVYGQSKAGKTSFLETMLKMMIGQKTKISAPDFTRSSIENLKRAVEGAPIIVDDLTNTRFNQHAIETIKNDDFGVADGIRHYPAVVISANEDVKAVAPEVIRRTVVCRVQAGLTNTEVMKSSVVRRVQRNIGTAFYREYLRRMLEVIPDLIEQLKDEDEDSAPDILAVSSEIICDIISECTNGDIPDYVRELTLEDYFSEKVTGSYARKTIQDAWRINRKSFVVLKRTNELRYNAGQTWEADRILKELPEDLEAHKSREWVVMNLDSACDFFDIKFSRFRLF